MAMILLSEESEQYDRRSPLTCRAGHAILADIPLKDGYCESCLSSAKTLVCNVCEEDILFFKSHEDYAKIAVGRSNPEGYMCNDCIASSRCHVCKENDKSQIFCTRCCSGTCARHLLAHMLPEDDDPLHPWYCQKCTMEAHRHRRRKVIVKNKKRHLVIEDEEVVAVATEEEEGVWNRQQPLASDAAAAAIVLLGDDNDEKAAKDELCAAFLQWRKYRKELDQHGYILLQQSKEEYSIFTAETERLKEELEATRVRARLSDLDLQAEIQNWKIHIPSSNRATAKQIMDEAARFVHCESLVSAQHENVARLEEAFHARAAQDQILSMEYRSILDRCDALEMSCIDLQNRIQDVSDKLIERDQKKQKV